MSAKQSNLEAVLQALVPGADLAHVAAAHGLTNAQLRELVDAYLAGARSTIEARPATAKRPWKLFGAVAAVVALSLGSLTAFAQSVTCTQTLPNGLKTFCANAPAIAADVNSNFQTLINLLGQKTGTVGADAVTMQSTLTTAQGITASTGNIVTSNGSITATNGNVNAPQGSFVGINVNASGNVSTGTLDVSTNASVQGLLSGGTIYSNNAVVAPGQIIGGGVVTCNASSSVQWDCGSWGQGFCPSGCGEGCPAGSTARLTGTGYCYSVNGQAYCLGWVCVRN